MPLRILTLFLALAAVLLSTASAGRCAPSEHDGILVLFSGTEPPPGASALLHGVRSESRELPVTSMYLGLGPEADEEDALGAWKRLRSRADAAGAGIIAVGEPAVSFVRMFRPLAPLDSPISLVRHAPLPETFATADNGTAAETVKMVFDAAPGTTTLIVFTGTGRRAHALRRTTAKRFRPYMGRAQLIFPGYEKGREGLLRRHEILRIAANAPSGSSLLLLGYPTEDSVAGLTQAVVGKSPVPVFAGEDVPFVPGMTGAAVTDWRAHGRAAARALFEHPRSGVRAVPPLVQRDLPREPRGRALSVDDAPEDAPQPDEGSPLTVAAAGVAVALLAAILLKGRRG